MPQLIGLAILAWVIYRFSKRIKPNKFVKFLYKYFAVGALVWLAIILIMCAIFEIVSAIHPEQY